MHIFEALRNKYYQDHFEDRGMAMIVAFYFHITLKLLHLENYEVLIIRLLEDLKVPKHK